MARKTNEEIRNRIDELGARREKLSAKRGVGIEGIGYALRMSELHWVMGA